MAFGKTVLLIEDDFETAKWFQNLLEQKGFSVVLARDGLEGLNLARTEKADLVILELFLPTLNGYWVAGFIKRNKKLKETKILAISSRTTSNMQQLLQEAGIDRFVQLGSKEQSESNRSLVEENLELLVPQESVTP